MTAYPNVRGVEETLAALREFPRATGRNTLRRALLKAVKPVEIVARNLAPVDEADLARSIVTATQLTRHQRQTRANEVEVYVGPARGTGTNKYALNYASFVEFGTYHTTAQPYLRPAWDRTKGLVQTIFARELTIEFERSALRLSRKFHKIR